MNGAAAGSARRDLTIAAVSWLAVSAAWLAGPLRLLEPPVADLVLRAAHRPAPGRPRVAAVLIDDPAVRRLGPVPWPRSRIAELVLAVRRAKARAVVLDMLLPEPADADGDAALAAALAAGPAVVGAALDPGGGWLLPLPAFGGAARAGHVHGEVSGDGVVRAFLTTKQAHGVPLPALGIAAARLAGWEGQFDPGTRLRPDYSLRPGAVPAVGALEVLGSSAALAEVHGRVVFIGYAAAGAGDQFVIPVGQRERPAPGVLVHASLASSVIRGGLLRELPAWLAVAVAFLAALAAQLLRTRWGRFELGRTALLLLSLAAAGPVLVRLSGVLVPEVLMLSALAVSAATREAVEAREAHAEAGTILASLVAAGDGAAAAAPRGVRGRLRLVRALQGQLVRDRDLRRTLLEGLREGVVLWDDTGTPLVANAAAERLWGSVPALGQLAGAAEGGEPAAGDGAAGTEVERGGRELEIEVRAVEGGRLGLIRDVSVSRQLDRRRREMQRLVSHELKTPLASIAGFGEMLERYEVSPQELARVAGLIRGEAERLGTMVASFLDLERLASGREEAAREPLDLARLVRDRCAFLGPAAKRSGQSIVVTAPEPVEVAGAGPLLERVVDNLVGNALKHGPAGGVVTVTVASGGGEALLRVRDDGDGIPAQALAHLFERFYRVPGDRAPGSGLGLAFVKEIATWHGGAVEVASKPGRGAAFTVRLPSAGREEDG